MLVVYVSRPFDAVCCGSKGGCYFPVKQIERSTIWVSQLTSRIMMKPLHLK